LLLRSPKTGFPLKLLTLGVGKAPKLPLIHPETRKAPRSVVEKSLSYTVLATVRFLVQPRYRRPIRTGKSRKTDVKGSFIKHILLTGLKNNE
jgi:hypothetical protein